MARFDFSQPIEENKTLDMKWCCPALTLTCLTPGTATFWNKWAAKIRINDVELERCPSSYIWSEGQYYTTQVQPGDKFIYREVDERAFSKWSTTMSTSVNDGVTRNSAGNTPVVTSPDGATFELSLTEMETFLEEDGKTLPRCGFATFCADGAITKISDGSFDTSMVERINERAFFAFNSYGALESLPAGSFNTSRMKEVVGGASQYYIFGNFNYHGALKSLPDGSFDISHFVGTYGRYFCSYFNSYGALEHLPEGSFQLSWGVYYLDRGIFQYFNNCGALYDFPEGSFNTDMFIGGIPDDPADGVFDYFCYGAYNLTKLPYGSFRFIELRSLENRTASSSNFRSMFASSSSYQCTLPALPDWAFSFFNLRSLTGGGNYFIEMFSNNKNIKSIGLNCFDFHNLETVDCNFCTYLFSATKADDGHEITFSGSDHFKFDKLTTITRSFCSHFNSAGAIKELPSGSFRFSSSLTKVGEYFCQAFNQSDGSMESLPEESFNLDSLTEVGDGFLYDFSRSSSHLTKLPEGSFNISNIKKVGNYFCCGMFTADGNSGNREKAKSLLKLPAGSFRLSPELREVGNNFFGSFGATRCIFPEGSFNTENIEVTGTNFFSSFASNYYSMLTTDLAHKMTFPVGSFRFDKLRSVGTNVFYEFVRNCKGNTITGAELPEGSFQFPELRSVGANFCYAFMLATDMERLPEGSFSFPKLESADSGLFRQFNANNNTAGAIISLPAGSFQFPMLTADNVNPFNYFYQFNVTSSLAEGNRGVSIYLLHNVSSPNNTAQGTVPAGTYLYYNSDADASLSDLRAAMQDGTAATRFPVGTEFPDTWNGLDNPLIVAQYIDSTNSTPYGGKDGVLLIRKYPDPVAMAFGNRPGSYNLSTVKDYLQGEYLDKCSDELKANISPLTVPCYSNPLADQTWFLMSEVEMLGYSAGAQAEAEGFNWDIWKQRTGLDQGPQGGQDDTANEGRIIYDRDGNAVTCWTRTSVLPFFRCVRDRDGAFYGYDSTQQYGVLPACFIAKNPS